MDKTKEGGCWAPRREKGRGKRIKEMMSTIFLNLEKRESKGGGKKLRRRKKLASAEIEKVPGIGYGNVTRRGRGGVKEEGNALGKEKRQSSSECRNLLRGIP